MNFSKSSFLVLTTITMVAPFFVTGQSYRPNEALRTELRKVTWNVFKPATPKKYRFLTSMVFNSNKCFELYEEAARKHDFPTYDPITVLTFREVILNEAVRGRDYSDAEIKEAYQKIKKVHVARQDKSLSNDELQEKLDPIILEALWMATLNEFSKGRDEEVKKLALKRLGHEDERELVAQKEKDKMPSKPTVTPRKGNAKTVKGTIPEVSDIILRTVTNYGLNGAYVDNEVSILFANGEILTNPSEPLDQLNINQSKQRHPKRWNYWKMKGDVLYVTKPWKNKTYDWKKWFNLRSGPKGHKIAGRYNTLDGFGGATVVNASMVSFDAQGRFAWKTIKGGSSDWKAIYSKSNSAGTYEIDKYKITLKYNNGTKESFFFGLYPKDNEHFVIGTSHFAPVKK